MTTESNNPNWYIYQGTNEPHEVKEFPAPPPWRNFSEEKQDIDKRGSCYIPNPQDIALVNAAIYLRRPLLVEGKAGVGKTSLAYSVAHELKLGEVLRWSITTRTTLKDGLYQYDAIGRLQDKSLHNDKSPEINEYLRLGALGTAFANKSDKPRVLLIDEIDKSDIDLPNDLLHIFEEGKFEIPELVRLKGASQIRTSDDEKTVEITDGKIPPCKQFPLVIMTSNGEREFPPAFLRRCLRLKMESPDIDKLTKIVNTHLAIDDKYSKQVNILIEDFFKRLKDKDLATDQLLNAVYLTLHQVNLQDEAQLNDKEKLIDLLWQSLSNV